MRIFYLANMRLPTEKAHGVQIMHMCSAFAALGHDVQLVIPWRFNHMRGDPFELYGVPRTFKIFRVPSLDLVRFGKHGFFIQYATYVIAAVLYAAFTRPDIVYSRSAATLVFCRKFGLRGLIWEAHTASWNVFAARAARLVRLIVVISGGLHDFYKKHGVSEEKMMIAHDGVDIAEFSEAGSPQAIRAKFGIPPNAFIVMYVGKLRTMGETKGTEELFDIVGALRKERNRARFVLVGLNPEDEHSAQELAEKAGLSADSVVLVPHVPRRDVPAYLKAADVLVMNYPNTPHYARMMSPLKLFEYMASGVPIVSSDLPSIREVLDDTNAFLVPPEDSSLFTRALQDVIDNPDAARRRAEAALRRVQDFTWRARANNILARGTANVLVSSQ